MINGDFNNVLPVDLVDPQQVQEFVDHARYRYPNDQVGRHPFDGITDPWYNPGDVKGSDTNIQQRMNRNATRGSKRHAGAVTRWKWAAGTHVNRLSQRRCCDR